VDPKITVLIANAFPLVRNSMKDLLDSAPNLEVAGCAKTKDEVFALVDAHRQESVFSIWKSNGLRLPTWLPSWLVVTHKR